MVTGFQGDSGEPGSCGSETSRATGVKNLQGMETTFPRCKRKAIQKVVDTIPAGLHPFPCQAGFSRLQVSFPGIGVVSMAFM